MNSNHLKSLCNKVLVIFVYKQKNGSYIVHKVLYSSTYKQLQSIECVFMHNYVLTMKIINKFKSISCEIISSFVSNISNMILLYAGHM